jgi:hypothetical protein
MGSFCEVITAKKSGLWTKTGEEGVFVAKTLLTNLAVGIRVLELYGMAVANPDAVKTSRAVTTAAMARPLFLERMLLSPKNDF